MNKANRPLAGGEKKDVNQYVYIGFVGYKSCGKPVHVDDVPLARMYVDCGGEKNGSK